MKTDRSYSYASVIDKSERLAAGLRDLGLRPGDVLCMMTKNNIDIPIFFLAVNLLGGVFQPLSVTNTDGKYNLCGLYYCTFAFRYTKHRRTIQKLFY